MNSNSQSGFSVRKPVKFWNKPLRADFKELFKALSKAGINAALAKWDSVATDGVDALTAIGLAQTPEEVAWLLIYRSLTQAMFNLLEEKKELVVKQPSNDELEQLSTHLSQQLEEKELYVDEGFFKQPRVLPILEDIKTIFTEWLQAFGLTPAQSISISNRLPAYLVFALHQEWAEHRDKYSQLEPESTPFSEAYKREQAWQRYSAWLQKEVEKPLFAEAFSLKRVYIPLRAYYQRKIEGKQNNESISGIPLVISDDKQYERVVVQLQDELNAWLAEAKYDDAIRIISGGPGSGKSSLTKIFAAEQASKGEVRILFIPLHFFDFEANLIEAINNFVAKDNSDILPHKPLERANHEPRLLIIFDGLDELAMQGKVGSEVAQQFVREVDKQVNWLNRNNKTCVQVLISGRELVIQANRTEFRKPKQVLHLLPYFVTEEEIEDKNYIDAENFLNHDQRKDWWLSYGEASGRGYTDLPQELNEGRLSEVTSQPLLNYLVALSFAREKLVFSEASSLNEIYQDLLDAVYERVWGEPKINVMAQGIKKEDFVRILEGIAIAAWHGGDGRVATVTEIEKQCDSGTFKRVLDAFRQDNKASLTRLLTAFYFRQSGLKGNDETFEFTHKSFGEYLTAKRLVREVQDIQEMQELLKKHPKMPWNEKEALKAWAKICGSTAMDTYILDFVRGEMQLKDNQPHVGKWQQTLSKLISNMLCDGMPMEELKLLNFREGTRQARNAEEALLAVLNACARVTQVVSDIEWPSDDAFGAWIARLQGQRIGDKTALALQCLDWLNLKNCILAVRDFIGASLNGARLDGARLEWASLNGARLDGARLDGARLDGARLEWAHLDGASLVGASLVGASLVGASLNDASLNDASLNDASLDRASLDRASLDRARLVGASLVGASLVGASLDGASLDGASLDGASLDGASLNDASLNDASLDRARLVGASLDRARLDGAILDGAILDGTILEDKNLTEEQSR